MMTIEEAWNALEFRQGDRPQMDAVRALVLAALEEAEDEYPWAGQSRELRRRIEALGLRDE